MTAGGSFPVGKEKQVNNMDRGLDRWVGGTFKAGSLGCHLLSGFTFCGGKCFL